jgi:dihydroorotase
MYGRDFSDFDFKIVIQNAALPNGTRTSIGIRNGVIHQIAPWINIKHVQTVINAYGLHVVPGLINTHVHDRTPGGEHKEDWDSIERSAIAGGVTTVCVMPNTNPPIVTEEALCDKIKRVGAREINWLQWAGTTGDNLDELRALLKGPRVPGVKLYMSETTGVGGVIDPKRQRKVYEIGAECGCPVPTHAQDQALMDRNRRSVRQPLRLHSHCEIQTTEVEVSAVKQALQHGKDTGAHVWICHVSCPESVELCMDAKERGQKVTVELAPQYLYLWDTLLSDPRFGARVKVNPSLRSFEQVERMREYLDRPGYFDVVGDDHAPHLLSEKRQRSYDRRPSGMPGLQTTFSLLADLVFEDDLPLERFVELTSTNAADLLGLKNKGRIQEGADADLVLADFSDIWGIQDRDIVSKCGWTPYRQRIVHGVVRYTIVGGKVHKLKDYAH